MKYKARFAPSPTGLLHIGNARSALINWAFIKNKGGEFLLRIDDTDKTRSKKEYEKSIKDDLSWLGINWSKTFNQSERIELYKKIILELKEKKLIYPCFETEEELSLKRKSLLSMGKPPIYDRSSLNLSKEKIELLLNQGKKPHWRFKLINEKIEWNDLIKGTISFDSKNISDPILIRGDGSLLYHLPSVIDDIEEDITDIIRGEDHISNTAYHIQIFKSLNAKVPNFGHHPFITDDKGKGFAKRLGSVSIQKLSNQGYENITLINYLLSLGTNKNISKEKNIEKLYKNFNINDLATSSPKFSINDLTNLNKDILKLYDYFEIKERFSDFKYKNVNENFWKFIKNNINFFNESFEWIEIINDDSIFNTESNKLLIIAGELLPEDPFDENTWDFWLNSIKNKTGKSGKDLFMPLRIALTGRKTGPELKFLMPLLSRNQVLKKLGFNV